MTISHTTPFLYRGMVARLWWQMTMFHLNISLYDDFELLYCRLSVVCCVCTMFGVSLKKVVKLILFEFHGIWPTI